MKMFTVSLFALVIAASAQAQSFKEYGDYSCTVRCKIEYGGYHPNTAYEYLTTKFRIPADTFRYMTNSQKQNLLKNKAESQTQNSCQAFCSASWDAKRCTTSTEKCVIVGGR